MCYFTWKLISFQGSSTLENKLSKYFCEIGWWFIAEISNEYNSLELSFSSMIILEPLSKWWSLTTNKLVFSDVCLIHFLHISGMAFTSCDQENWSLFWRANSVFRMFQFLTDPYVLNSWVIQLIFFVEKTSSRQPWYQFYCNCCTIKTGLKRKTVL